MSIISAETALEESVQFIEENYSILLDRSTAQFTDNFSSDSGSGACERHGSSHTVDRMGQSASESYDKLALLRSQVYFHRQVVILLCILSMMRSCLFPDISSTICSTSAPCNSES